MTDTPTFGRYAEIPVDRMTSEQREAYRFLVEGPRGRLPGPYKVWVHNPFAIGPTTGSLVSPVWQRRSSRHLPL